MRYQNQIMFVVYKYTKCKTLNHLKFKRNQTSKTLQIMFLIRNSTLKHNGYISNDNKEMSGKSKENSY